jgi:hypothetical protein
VLTNEATATTTYSASTATGCNKNISMKSEMSNLKFVLLGSCFIYVICIYRRILVVADLELDLEREVEEAVAWALNLVLQETLEVAEVVASVDLSEVE